jgi:hypothetical protein
MDRCTFTENLAVGGTGAQSTRSGLASYLPGGVGDGGLFRWGHQMTNCTVTLTRLWVAKAVRVVPVPGQEL